MAAGSALALAPAAAVCPHVLGRWMLRTAKSSAERADGSPRPVEQRGGRIVRVGAGCVFTPGHRGPHRAEDGRTWT